MPSLPFNDSLNYVMGKIFDFAGQINCKDAAQKRNQILSSV